MSFAVEMKTIPETKVMFIEASMPHEKLSEMGVYFDRLFSYIAGAGGQITGSFVRYLNGSIEKMDMEICISVQELIAQEGEIKAKIIPKTQGRMAVGQHKGSYAGIPQFYQDFTKWFAEQGLKYADAPMWEFYLNNPAETPEDELLTEVIFAIGE